MKPLSWISTLLIAVIFLPTLNAADLTSAPITLKVLAIGNSYSINMAGAVPPVAKALGHRIDICTMFIGGCSLERHCNNLAKTNATPYLISWQYDNIRANPAAPFCNILKERTNKKNGKVEKVSNIRAMLRAEKWDIVVIQQASQESWKAASFHPYGDTLVQEIRSGAPQARILVHETWSYVSFCPRLQKWGIDQDEMYTRLHKNYADFAAGYGFKVIPVGTAVQLYRKRLPVKSTATEVGGDPVGRSPTGDSIHMNADGNHLQALVWTSALLDIDVTACTYVPDGIDPKRAALMRTCAREVTR